MSDGDYESKLRRDLDRLISLPLHGPPFHYKPFGNSDQLPQPNTTPQPTCDREIWESTMRNGGWRQIRSWKHAMQLVRRQVKATQSHASRLRSGFHGDDAKSECIHGLYVVSLLQPGNWVKFTKTLSKPDSHKVLAVAVSPWSADYRREMQEKKR